MPGAKAPPPTTLHSAVLERLSGGSTAVERICAECAPEVAGGVVGIGDRISLLGLACSRCGWHYCRFCGHRLIPITRVIRCGSCRAKNRFSRQPLVWVDVAPPLPTP
jgi:hypothetical protein